MQYIRHFKYHILDEQKLRIFSKNQIKRNSSTTCIIIPKSILICNSSKHNLHLMTRFLFIFVFTSMICRGPTLETVVVRMRIFCEAYAMKIKEVESQRELPVDTVKAVQKSV